MGIDVRIPIGLLFAVVGLILTIFGAVSDRAIYQRSLGINVNFGWGLVLLAFGIVMLLLGRRGSRNAPPTQPASDGPRRTH
jgi:hypothetical protein